MSHRYRILHYLLRNQVIFALGIVILAWFIMQIHSILVSFFLSYIVASALLPFSLWLRAHKFPWIVAIIIPYLTGIIVIAALVSIIVNSFIPEFQRFAINFPTILDKSAQSLGLPIDGKTIQNYLSHDFSSVGQNAIGVTTRVFGGVFSVVTVLIVSFYLLFYHELFHNWLSALLGVKYQKPARQILDEVEEKLGAWARGQLLLSVCICLSIFIALTLLGIPYALPLGIMAGLFEFIPTLGPTLAAIPSVIVALTISPSLGITVIVLYILIQFIESHILVPNIMQKAVGLNPVLVILGIGVGATLLGIPGALLAVPFISFLAVIASGIQKIDK